MTASWWRKLMVKWMKQPSYFKVLCDLLVKSIQCLSLWISGSGILINFPHTVSSLILGSTHLTMSTRTPSTCPCCSGITNHNKTEVFSCCVACFFRIGKKWSPVCCSMFDSAALVFWPCGLIVREVRPAICSGPFFFLQLSLYIWIVVSKWARKKAIFPTEWPADPKIGWVWLGTSQFKMSVSFCCDFVQSGVKPRWSTVSTEYFFWNSETTFLIFNCSSSQKTAHHGLLLKHPLKFHH